MHVLCDLCVTLIGGKPDAKPHEGLRSRGTQVVQGPGGMMGDVELHHYACARCGTLWLQRFGKWGDNQGFRLKPGSR